METYDCLTLLDTKIVDNILGRAGGSVELIDVMPRLCPVSRTPEYIIPTVARISLKGKLIYEKYVDIYILELCKCFPLFTRISESGFVLDNEKDNFLNSPQNFTVKIEEIYPQREKFKYFKYQDKILNLKQYIKYLEKNIINIKPCKIYNFNLISDNNYFYFKYKDKSFINNDEQLIRQINTKTYIYQNILSDNINKITNNKSIDKFEIYKEYKKISNSGQETDNKIKYLYDYKDYVLIELLTIYFILIKRQSFSSRTKDIYLGNSAFVILCLKYYIEKNQSKKI